MKNKTNILFWNVDTQIDFMKADGKLYVRNAEEIEPVLAQLTAFAEKHNINVVNTCDYHNEKSLELSDKPDFITTFPPHCMENTEGQDFIKATRPENAVVFEWSNVYSVKEIKEMTTNRRNIVIRKDVFDVFENPNTENIVNVLVPKQIFVYGVAANVCVDFAVRGLAKRNYKVFVVKNAIKELPDIPTPFEDWQKQGIIFIDAQEIADYL